MKKQEHIAFVMCSHTVDKVRRKGNFFDSNIYSIVETAKENGLNPIYILEFYL